MQEKPRITLNIRYSALHNPEATLEWLRKAQPAGAVLELISINDLNVAYRFRDALPSDGTLVVRVKDGEDGAYWDVNSRHYMTPQAFLDKYGEFGKNGLTLQVLCEPSFGGDVDTRDRMIAWMASVTRLATKMDIAVCVYNAATGNPSVNSAIDWSGFASLLVAITSNPKHMLGLHIYRRFALPLGWMDSIRPLVAYCKANNLRLPRVVVTEHGAEGRGGEGDSGWSGPRWDMTEDEYVDMLHTDYRDQWEQYVEMGVLEWLALFAASDKGGQWSSFNVMPILDELLDAINDGWFVTVSAPQEEPFFAYQADVNIELGGLVLMFRKEPNTGAEVLTRLKGLYRNMYIIGKAADVRWTWYKMTVDGKTGWFAAIPGVTVTPVIPVIVPDPEPEPDREPINYEERYVDLLEGFRKVQETVKVILDKYGIG